MAEAGDAARARGYEPDQPKLRGVALGAAAIIGAVVVAIVVAYLLVRGLPADQTAEKPREPPAIRGGPRLQATPERDFAAFHAGKWRLVHEYGWVDRERGIVRIPIDRAMALLVQQQRDAAVGDASGRTSATGVAR
jgi:hypothetical protein